MSDEEHRLLLLKMRDFEKATVGEIISPSYQAFTCYPDFTQCPQPDATGPAGEIL